MKTPPTNPRRILIRSVNWLGDAVMTTPALLRLRERFPQAHITLLCPEKLRDLWLKHPAINEVITFPAKEGLLSVSERLKARSFLKSLKLYKGALAQGIAELQHKPAPEIEDEAGTRGFDLAVVFPNSPRSALEVFLARIPHRIGYARPWRNFFLTHTVASRPDAVKMRKRTRAEIKALVAAPNPVPATPPPASAHQIHEYLHLVAALGANPEPLAPRLLVTNEEVAAAKKKFRLENVTGPIIGLNPGAEYGPAKRWPVEKFIAAAQAIQKQTHCTWLLFGGKNDQPTTAQIHSALITHPLSLNLAGQTTLRELMALLKSCQVLLTNDTGPMHVAAALGVPVVAPFGSTSPELTGPGLPGDSRHRLLKADVPCSPCFLRECPIDFRCMNGISVDRVVAAVVANCG